MLRIAVYFQASCPTMQGNMMVASLSNEEHLSSWFFDGSEPLKLRVRVHPMRQLFASKASSHTTLYVVCVLTLRLY